MKNFKKFLALFMALLIIFQVSPMVMAEKAENHIVLSVEKFTLGQGFYFEPTLVEFKEGDKLSSLVLENLKEDNIQYSTEYGFYMTGLKDNNLNIKDMPEFILKETGKTIEDLEKLRTDKKWLAAMDYTETSGFMYSVNSKAPSVGMSDYEVKNGDVVRIQYSLINYGEDVGLGFEKNLLESYPNLDSALTLIAELNSLANLAELLQDKDFKVKYDTLLRLTTNLESKQDDIDKAVANLSEYVKPVKYKFTDVNNKHFAFEHINSLVDKNILSGVTETSFEPNREITRAEFVAILARLNGVNDKFENHFEDVKKDSWYANYVNWAYDQKIVTGVNAKEFDPNSNISRQDMATMIKRYIDLNNVKLDGSKELIKFKDMDDIAGYAEEAVNFMVMNEIIQGKENNFFKPQDFATRAEAATMINRFLSK